MKLRKLMALGMAGVMAFSLAACGGGGSEEPAADNGNAAEADGGEEAAAGDVNKSIAYIVGNLGDKSFNDSGETGMVKLREAGWDCKTIEAGDETKADKWEDTMLDAIDEGYHYLVASSTYRDIMLKLA